MLALNIQLHFFLANNEPHTALFHNFDFCFHPAGMWKNPGKSGVVQVVGAWNSTLETMKD